MSSVFDIDTSGQRQLEEEAALNPLDPAQIDPNFWRGTGQAIGSGIMRGGAKTLDALVTAGSMLEGNTKKPQQKQMREEAIALNERLRKGALEYWTPKAEEVGAAGRVLGSLAEMAIPLMAGAGNPSLLLGSATLDTGKTMIDQGVDARTAIASALLTDVTLAAGFRIPFVGKTIPGRMASGVAGNVAIGLPSREGQQAILESAGYTALAEQYDYNAEAFMLDAMTGAAFGGLSLIGMKKGGEEPSPMKPEEVDALLSAKNAKHFQQDTAPGRPADTKAAVEHQRAMGDAIEQLLKGEPVNVADSITEAAFIKATPAETPITRAIESAYPDLVPVNDLTALPLERRQALRFNAPELDAFAATIESKYGLPSGLINAIKNAGERSNSNQTSPAGARGVMQFMPENLKKYGVKDPTDPVQMIDAAGRYLKATLKQYKGDVQAVIADYNGGPRQANRVAAGGQPAAAETRAYVTRVTDAMRSNEGKERVVKIRESSLDQENQEVLVRLFDEAEALKPDFDKQVLEIAALSGGEAMLAPLKGLERSVSKIVGDYGGNAARLTDILRATVLVEESVGAQAATKMIEEKYKITGRPRNLLRDDVDPVDGYRDAMYKIEIDGHKAEIQVNLPEMITAKGKAHKFYEERSQIEREIVANTDGRATSQQQARIDELNARMREIYKPAWEAAKAKASLSNIALKDSTSIGEPLRRAEAGSNERGGTLSQATQYPTTGKEPSDTGISSTSKNSAINSLLSDKIIAGRKATVTTERGMTVQTRYAVTDIGSLVTSHLNDLKTNPDFPAALQPRDRARAASEAQISRIENAINPELLGATPKAGDGAPIVGADMVVESGNARTIALRRAYDGGKADNYKQWLIDNAERFGLDPAAVAKLDKPTLVRVGQGDYNRAEFARQANESTIAQMSVTELAKSDAERTPDLMGLVTNEDGSINPIQSAPFIQGFMRHVVSPSEHGTMMTADGMLSQQGLQRIRNAVFAKAYGDPEIVAMMAESTDANVRNVLAGMLRAAPAVARLKELIEAGARYPIDVTADMVLAIRQFSQLKRDGMKVKDMLDQGALFDTGLRPEVQNLMIGLEENARAPKRVAELIGRTVDEIDRLGDPRQASMFGEIQQPTGAELILSAIESVRKDFEVKPTADLFNSPEITAARQVLDQSPDARIVMDDGREVSVREAMREVEDAQVLAKEDVKAFDAAVTCYMRQAA